MKRKTQKVYKSLPPHTNEAHPIANAGQYQQAFHHSGHHHSRGCCADFIITYFLIDWWEKHFIPAERILPSKLALAGGGKGGLLR